MEKKKGVYLPSAKVGLTKPLCNSDFFILLLVHFIYLFFLFVY